MPMKVSGTAADGRDYSFKINIDHGFQVEGAIGEFLMQGRFYEPDVSAIFATVLRPGDSVIDCGANVGWFSLLAAALVGPQGRVLAFEPDPVNVEKFEKNRALCGFDNIDIIAKPVSDKVGKVQFHFCADGTGGHALWDPGRYPLNANTRAAPRSSQMMAATIDEFALQHYRSLRLIKLDIEGAELRALTGAQATIARCRPPFIVAELHEFALEQMGDSQAALRRFMHGLGYDTFVMFTQGTMPTLVPPGTAIDTPVFLINILFSTPQAIGECWPKINIGSPRFINGFAPAVRSATA